MNRIEIKENKITMGQYLLYTLKGYIKNWWWAYALPLVLCIALSVVNINFLFVAIILLFLVFMMILFFVVIYYGIVPESRYSTLKKDIELNNEGITLHLKKPVIELNADEKNTIESVEKKEEKPTVKYDFETVVIEWDRIKCVKGSDECMLLTFHQPKYSFLAIPYDAFDDETHLRDSLSLIRSCIG